MQKYVKKNLVVEKSSDKMTTLSVSPAFSMSPWMRQNFGFLEETAKTREAFFERVGEIFPPASKQYKRINKAYKLAEKLFEGIYRENGESYFEHLRCAALIALVVLRERRVYVIIAILHHDTLEDIPEWDYWRLRRYFGGKVGKRVAETVWWVSKPKIGGRFKTRAMRDLKHHRNLWEAPRPAIIVKLCDRIQNLMTPTRRDRERVRGMVGETQHFFVGLAEKHQLFVLELEDMCAHLITEFGFENEL